jgi:hypothetical protein
MCFQKSSKELDRTLRQSMIDANIPQGYNFLTHRDPGAKRHLKMMSLIIFISVGIIVFFLNLYIRPEFDTLRYILIHFSGFQQRMTNLLWIMLTAFLAGGVLHEVIHGICILIFTHKIPKFGCRNWNPYTVLRFHTYLTRNQAIISAIAPLAFAIMSLTVLWPFIAIELLPYLIVADVTIIASAIGDIYSFIEYLSESKDILVGFDGIAGAIYAP